MFLLENNRCLPSYRRLVQRVVILRFQNGRHDPRISTNVFLQASVVVGIIELSAVDRPY